MPDLKPFPACVTDADGCKWDVTPEGQLVRPYVPIEYPKAVVNADGASVIVADAAAEHAHHAKAKPPAPNLTHAADVALKHDAKLVHDETAKHDAHDPKHDVLKSARHDDIKAPKSHR